MTVDPATPEGLLARFAHYWRVFRAAPLVEQPLHAGNVDLVLADHEAAGGNAADDAAVAQAAVNAKAAAAELPALPTEPFGTVVDPAAPAPVDETIPPPVETAPPADAPTV